MKSDPVKEFIFVQLCQQSNCTNFLDCLQHRVVGSDISCQTRKHMLDLYVCIHCNVTLISIQPPAQTFSAMTKFSPIWYSPLNATILLDVIRKLPARSREASSDTFVVLMIKSGRNSAPGSVHCSFSLLNSDLTVSCSQCILLCQGDFYLI